MKNLIELLKNIKTYKKWALIAPLLVIIEVIVDLLLPTIMANIVNIGIGTNNPKYIIANVLLMVFLSIVGIICGVGGIYYATLVSESTVADIREKLFEKINNLSLFNFTKLKTGKIITILTNDTSVVGNVIMMSLRFIFRVPIIMIGSIVMAILISPKLSLILLFFIPIIALTIVIIIKRAFPYFTITQESVDNVNSVVRENLSGIRVVKSYVMEEYEIEKFDKVNKEMKDVLIIALRFLVLTMPLMMLFINLATVFVLWYGGKMVIAGSMQIGSIMAFIQYLTNILTTILMASMAIAVTTRSIVSANRIAEILNLEEDVKEIKSPIFKERMLGNITFENVSFSYESGSGDYVIKDISFNVEKGCKVAILGPTGSGKTTIASLIARFYDPLEGRILIDGVDIKKYSLSTLRNNISVVFQQAKLFSDTVENNIKYGCPEASINDVIKASKTAHAHKFINNFPEKYNYIVEQNATNLSGGQKQRISLARAIIMRSPILILDDTTSAIDMKTEKLIRQSLKKDLKDQTVLMITQRIATALDADKIIVLDDGKITGIGTHNSLIKTNDMYKSIYDSQLSKGVIK